MAKKEYGRKTKKSAVVVEQVQMDPDVEKAIALALRFAEVGGEMGAWTLANATPEMIAAMGVDPELAKGAATSLGRQLRRIRTGRHG